MHVSHAPSSKTQMSSLVLLFFLTVGFPIWPQELAQASAEPSAAITGMVLDPSGAAVSGAQVSLTIKDGTVLKATTTDSAGAFRLSNVAPGTYEVHVEASGFQPRNQSVIVDRKPPSPLRINLVIASQN